MITFMNGVSLETIAVWGGSMEFQSATRSTLEFRFAEDATTFEDLKDIYANTAATQEITISDGDTIQSLHINYTLPVELSYKVIDGANVYTMKLAQKSQLEIMQEQQAMDISDTQIALIEVADLISGGEE